ncbi:Serine/threonine-protein kinase [Actinidia chinensis var. chinensis]|uniref:Serine/threonine-protein kinase n=1 Tax=Actinidia chinensis var. chinensis TaxID=1590841 RepID=A0A2R6QNR3_ACTCC|nr:Serine/threonine-protein kinase [Actinidia chinensis var. chinensis]
MANVAFISRSNYFLQQQLPLPSTQQPIHVFLIPVLVNFVKLKYQGTDTCAFETHRKTMILAAASFLLYCLALSRGFRSGGAFLGWLSSLSLASVLVPVSIRPVLFLLCVMFAAGELLKCKIVQVVWYWLRQRMRGNTVHGRRIGRALIGPSRFVAHAYTGSGRRALLSV